ncbi:MAG: hypothetical protein HQ582_15405 [Planctomycetes bacterium]|nr:hypothetical protein [Planctomycetota bacterium]
MEKMVAGVRTGVSNAKKKVADTAQATQAGLKAAKDKAVEVGGKVGEVSGSAAQVTQAGLKAAKDRAGVVSTKVAEAGSEVVKTARGSAVGKRIASQLRKEADGEDAPSDAE